MAKRIKILKTYNAQFVVGSEHEVADNIAEFLMANQFASFHGVVEKKKPCADKDCKDCEDCSDKAKAKKDAKKKSEKKPTKKPTKK
tara:strand:+ start:380 stop:637 length:258 start_codon:yes stop_codon:yes gene_type:complete